MTTPTRRTLARSARLQGVALFTGRPASCVVHPAPAGHAITLERPDAPPIPASITSLSDRAPHPALAGPHARCTTLAHPDAPNSPVFTVEHLLSALAGLGVTAARVELDAPELPNDDGAALARTSASLDAGLVPLDAPPHATLRPVVVRETLRVEARAGRITAEPLAPGESPSFTYLYEPDPASPIPAQHASWDASPESYAREVAPARTFSTAAEATLLRSLGLFTAFTPRDLLVISEHGPIDNTWRFENEPARHKLLDLVGDLSLVQRPIHARIRAVRSGHSLNHAMARALMAHAATGR